MFIFFIQSSLQVFLYNFIFLVSLSENLNPKNQIKFIYFFVAAVVVVAEKN